MLLLGKLAIVCGKNVELKSYFYFCFFHKRVLQVLTSLNLSFPLGKKDSCNNYFCYCTSFPSYDLKTGLRDSGKPIMIYMCHSGKISLTKIYESK